MKGANVEGKTYNNRRYTDHAAFLAEHEKGAYNYNKRSMLNNSECVVGHVIIMRVCRRSNFNKI